MKEPISTLVMSTFVVAWVLGVVFYVYTLILAHRRIDELDEFATGRSGFGTDNFVFKIMRMIRYMMAASSPFLNRRTFPDRDFRELPVHLRRSLAFGFWVLAIAGALTFALTAWFYIFVD